MVSARGGRVFSLDFFGGTTMNSCNSSGIAFPGKRSLIGALVLVLGLGVTGVAQAQEIKPPPTKPPVTKPVLHMVSVGVSQFKNNELPPLQSPHHDAQDMAKLFQGQQGKLFSQAE